MSTITIKRTNNADKLVRQLIGYEETLRKYDHPEAKSWQGEFVEIAHEQRRVLTNPQGGYLNLKLYLFINAIESYANLKDTGKINDPLRRGFENMAMNLSFNEYSNVIDNVLEESNLSKKFINDNFYVFGAMKYSISKYKILRESNLNYKNYATSLFDEIKPGEQDDFLHYQTWNRTFFQLFHDYPAPFKTINDLIDKNNNSYISTSENKNIPLKRNTILKKYNQTILGQKNNDYVVEIEGIDHVISQKLCINSNGKNIITVLPNTLQALHKGNHGLLPLITQLDISLLTPFNVFKILYLLDFYCFLNSYHNLSIKPKQILSIFQEFIDYDKNQVGDISEKLEEEGFMVEQFETMMKIFENYDPTLPLIWQVYIN